MNSLLIKWLTVKHYKTKKLENNKMYKHEEKTKLKISEMLIEDFEKRISRKDPQIKIIQKMDKLEIKNNKEVERIKMTKKYSNLSNNSNLTNNSNTNAFTSMFLQPIDLQFIPSFKNSILNKISENKNEKLNKSTESDEDIYRKCTDTGDLETNSLYDLTPDSTKSNHIFSNNLIRKTTYLLPLNNKILITKLLTKNWEEKLNCVKYKVFKSLTLLVTSNLQNSTKNVSKIFLSNILKTSPIVEKLLLQYINLRLPLGY